MLSFFINNLFLLIIFFFQINWLFFFNFYKSKFFGKETFNFFFKKSNNFCKIFLNFIQLVTSYFISYLYLFQGFVLKINVINLTNYNVNIIKIILTLILLLVFLLKKTSFFYKIVYVEFLFGIFLLTNFSLILITLNNFYVIFFGLELIGSLILYILTINIFFFFSKKNLFNNSNSINILYYQFCLNSISAIFFFILINYLIFCLNTLDINQILFLKSFLNELNRELIFIFFVIIFLIKFGLGPWIFYKFIIYKNLSIVTMYIYTIIYILIIMYFFILWFLLIALNNFTTQLYSILLLIATFSTIIQYFYKNVTILIFFQISSSINLFYFLIILLNLINM